MVGTTREHQWRASLDGLNPNTRYCYRIYGDGAGLLGHARAPRFRTQVKQGGTAPFSFAVLGDWGAVDASGQNPDQAAVLHQIAQSPRAVRRDHRRHRLSERLATQLRRPRAARTGHLGRVRPRVLGTGGLFDRPVQRPGQPRPERDRPRELAASRAVTSSPGRYRMHRYCCVNHTAPGRYPSAWYAFDAGLARFYVLQAAWPNGNLGTGDMYRNDHDVHWRTSSAEMHWLRHDLRTHHRRVSFAFFHFPLYADSATEGSDPWLHGPRHLEGRARKARRRRRLQRPCPYLRAQRAIGTGHAHQLRDRGGGGKLQPVSGCGPLDRYAIGWAYSAHTHGSACGSAPTRLDRPTSSTSCWCGAWRS